MILLHAVKMTLSKVGREQHVDREDVTFYHKKTKTEAIVDLANLQRAYQALGKKIQFHLLHISDLGPWNEIEQDLRLLNGLDLVWMLKSKQEEVDNKE